MAEEMKDVAVPSTGKDNPSLGEVTAADALTPPDKEHDQEHG